MHKVHPAKLPDKGSSQPLWWEAASVPGLRGWWAEGAEAVTASHKPTCSALVRKEKEKEMPGGTGQKQKAGDRIYSCEHMTLLLIVLIPWEDSFSFFS